MLSAPMPLVPRSWRPAPPAREGAQRPGAPAARGGWSGPSERLIGRLEARGSYPAWVLLAALGGTFATAFPVTILTVSLGVIADEFHVRETTIAWVVSAPLLLSAVTLPLLGKLGDLRGHRRVFLLGLLASVLTAVATVFAWDAPSLIALRTLAAIVGGATQPAAMALILGTYRSDDRVWAMGWWSMTGAAAPAFGLVAGGPLVDLLGWRVVFLLQAALALVALAAAAALLRETPRRDARFDVAGALTLGVGVFGLMLAVGRVRDVGILAPSIGASVLAGLLGLAAFVRVERRAVAPLLPLEFFARRDFSASILANAFSAAAYMGAFAVAPLLFLDLFGFSVTATAGVMLLRTLSLTIASPIGGRLGGRIGLRAASVWGCLLIAVALAGIAYGALTVSLAPLAVGLVLQGIGHGLSQPPLTTAAAGAVPDRDLGIAAATNRLTGQVGVAFGITALTMVYGGSSTPEGFCAAFVFGGLLALVSTGFALAMEPPRSRGLR